MSTTRDFLYEIGCEELPSGPLIAATKQIQELIASHIVESGLSYSNIRCISSPRRLAVLVSDVPEHTEAIHKESRGPATRIAFSDGVPTKAAIGFAKGAGVEVDELEIRKDERGEEHVYALIDEPAHPALPLLAQICERITAQLSFPRSQRWDSEQVSFCRPIRWLCSLFGDEIVPVRYGSLHASNITYGHRALHPDAMLVPSPAEYEATLERGYVLDAPRRIDVIRKGVARVEEELKGARVDMPQKTFDEVVNLCEWPQVLVGSFDKEFLDVPHEIICESMLSHQRYFPIYDQQGELTCNFVIVSNADDAISQTVIAGNERVVRARLDDAKFFYEEDLKVPMDVWVEKLSQVVFHERLGSMRDKLSRMQAVVENIAAQTHMDAETAEYALRAAYLCKADLVSQAVVEFTSQQGVMGGYYAKAQGEAPEVATAIAEHYRPRFAKDTPPSTDVACAVAIADKLDTICGMHVIGEPPTGSSDPFAVRRAAIGVIAILRALADRMAAPIELETLIKTSLDSYVKQGLSFNFDEILAAIIQFMQGRLKTIAKDEKVSADTIEAVSATNIVDPVAFMYRVHALEDARTSQPELFEDLAVAYARAAHLTDKSLGTEVNKDVLVGAEKALYDACVDAKHNIHAALEENRYDEALSVLAALRAPIDSFFAEVLVMDENEELRANRLCLLNVFCDVFEGIANIGALARKK